MRHRLTTVAVWLVAAAAALALLSATTQGYKSFQARIPNGDKVPHPCKPEDGAPPVWPGVGHWRVEGAGERNAFGRDFGGNSNIWNETLCKLDSDGDGKTNGEELGDPSCVWVEGGTPSRTAQITHPGICEPVTSDTCKQRNGDKFTCGSTTHKSTVGTVCSLLLLSLLTSCCLQSDGRQNKNTC